MKKNIKNLFTSSAGYNWQYCSLGGLTRVKIATGDDIAHLPELDCKMWSVLSCPVSGLELDSTTLQLLDLDHDGKIRVDEVISTVKWLSNVFRSLDFLINGETAIYLNNINEDTEEGRTALEACRHILKQVDSHSEQFSMDDLLYFKKQLDNKEDVQDQIDTQNAVSLPAEFQALNEYIESLRAKVSDYFMRCKLVQFDTDCHDALDVSVERVASIASGNLCDATSEIASYPLARPQASGMLPLHATNPVWEDAMQALRTAAAALFPQADAISEQQWLEIVKQLDDFQSAKAEQEKKSAEQQSEKFSYERECYTRAERLLLMSRDFYTFIKNYVFFKDFYQTGTNAALAVFQAGKLFIDQRCCSLCLKVDNIDNHASSANLSGMFLIYCSCTAKNGSEKMNIVAVLTDGDTGNLRVGKNAIFYDRQGRDWDAVVTKIIDNPISIKQAFWSPYHKFWNWCTEKLNKSAAEKENQAFSDMTTKADTLTTNIAENAKAGKAGEKSKEADKKPAFDIAKFAGIFAAIGMAVGYISSAAVGLTKSIGDNPLNLVILVLGIILVVSGPSMFIAWSKLRKRNLGPLLNASGWAINAVILVNVRFGATLTSIARYPTLVLEDPFVEKKMPAWKKALIWITLALLVAGAIWLIFFMIPRIGEVLPLNVAADSIADSTVDIVAQ
ncbi:MAG: hypothetical protein KBT04_02185 [Bacteroidales bacterium]|nr:hypothetical protein [Candidatus Colimorpha onthohippi]